jgi:type I restriction enzyme S subunit
MRPKLVPLRRIAACLDGRRVPLNKEQRQGIQGDVPYWGAGGILDRINQKIFDEPLVLLGEDGAPFFVSGKDVAYYVDGPIWVNNHYPCVATERQNRRSILDICAQLC